MDNSNITASSDQVKNASTSAFLWALLLNGAIAIGTVTAFCILRPYNFKVYAPRTNLPVKSRRPPDPPRSFFGWIVPVVRMSNQYILDSCGPDALIMTRFLGQSCVLFAVLAVISMCSLISVDVTVKGSEDADAKELNILTMSNVYPTSERLWAHCAVAFLFTLALIYYIFRDALSYVDLRRGCLLNPNHQELVRAYTVLVMGIPKDYASVEKIKQKFDHLPGGVRDVYLCQGSKILQDAKDDRDKCQAKLESVLTGMAIKYYKKHRKAKAKDKDTEVKRPTQRTGLLGLVGSKVDAIEHNSKEIAELNRKLREAKASYDEQEFDNAAFVVFNMQIAAHMAVGKCGKLLDAVTATSFQPRFVDVEPKSVLWSNLRIHPLSRRARRIASLAVTTALIILWAIPVAFVSGVAQLSTLEQLKPFSGVSKLPSAVKGLIQGVLPAVALAVLNMVLLKVLRLLSRLEGVARPEDIELSLVSRLFAHQVFNVFIIVTISSSVFTVIKSFDEPVQLLRQISVGIPSVNVFFITYVLLLGLTGASGALARFVAVVLSKVLYRVFSWSPRQTLSKVQPQPFDFGTGIPGHSLVFLIGFVYSAIAPLMTVVCTFYFGMYWVVYRYQFLYVYKDDEFRLGGRTGRKYLSHRWAALYMFLILMLVLMSLSTAKSSTASSIARIVIMGIALGLTVICHLWMMYRVYPKLEYLPMSDISVDAAAGKSDEEYAVGMAGDGAKHVITGISLSGFFSTIPWHHIRTYLLKSPEAEPAYNASFVTIDEACQRMKQRQLHSGINDDNRVGNSNSSSSSDSSSGKKPTVSSSQQPAGEKHQMNDRNEAEALLLPSSSLSYPALQISELPPEIGPDDTQVGSTGDKTLTEAFRPAGFSDPTFTYVWVPQDPPGQNVGKMQRYYDECQELLDGYGKVYAEGAELEEKSGKVRVLRNHSPEHD